MWEPKAVVAFLDELVKRSAIREELAQPGEGGAGWLKAGGGAWGKHLPHAMSAALTRGLRSAFSLAVLHVPAACMLGALAAHGWGDETRKPITIFRMSPVWSRGLIRTFPS